MSLHVLVVARWYPSHDEPGRGSFVADHVAALAAAGADVTVASFDPTGVRGNEATRPERGAAAAAALAPALATADALARPPSWGAHGIPVARLPVILDGSRRRPHDIVEAHARALVPFGIGLAERWPVDIVHAHTGLPDGVAAARLAERLDVPLITTEHSSTAPDELADPEARDLYRTLLGRRRRALAVSAGLAAEIADRIGFDAREIGVLPNAVPIDRFPPGPPGDRDPHDLLYVGARKSTKGIETLLRAFAEIRLDDPDARLRLIGPPGTDDEEARWRELSEQLGIARATTIEGPAGRPAVAAAMRRAAVFVHPSPRETFGVVAAEALATGLPVAAVPSGGVEEIVGTDGRFGEIADDGRPASLATALRRVLARRSTFDPAAMRGHVLASFASDIIAGRTIELYERTIDARRAADRGPRPAIDRPAPGHRFTPPLVVGLVRELALGRLASLPPDLAGVLIVVTHPATEGAAPAPSERWLELDPERTYRDRLAELGGPVRAGPGSSVLGRLLMVARAPRAELERRALTGRRDELRRQTIDAFLLAAWETAGRPPFVLPLDADDILAVDPLLDTGARLAPGGLRWLVDRWDEAGRPTT